MVTPKTFHVKPMQQCILTVETPLCHAEVFLIKQWQLIQIIAYLSSLFRIRAIRVVKQIQYFFTVIRSCQDHTYLLVFHWIDNQVVLIQERITSIIFRVHDGADMIFSSYTFYLFNNLRIPPPIILHAFVAVLFAKLLYPQIYLQCDTCFRVMLTSHSHSASFTFFVHTLSVLFFLQIYTKISTIPNFQCLFFKK